VDSFSYGSNYTHHSVVLSVILTLHYFCRAKNYRNYKIKYHSMFHNKRHEKKLAFFKNFFLLPYSFRNDKFTEGFSLNYSYNMVICCFISQGIKRYLVSHIKDIK